MKQLANVIRNRKPLPYEVSQLLYGVSVVLTLLAAGSLTAR